ncbi:hypothetical protein [Chitinophaga sp.]
MHTCNRLFLLWEQQSYDVAGTRTGRTAAAAPWARRPGTTQFF